jgi:anthranilate phosphoribosyltransferase
LSAAVSTNLKPVLARLAAGESLSEPDAEAAFGTIMSGEATPAQIAGLLMAMRVRGETVPELTGAVRAMRARMTRVEAPADAMDVCGTGDRGHVRARGARRAGRQTWQPRAQQPHRGR